MALSSEGGDWLIVCEIGRELPPPRRKRHISVASLMALTIVAVALIASLVTVPFKNVVPKDDTSDREATISYVAHNPILIDGNAGFTNASGVVWGRGTESDPYIIRGWNITSSTANEIEIQNTDAYFVVEGCRLESGSLWYVGISLTNCTNGMLVNNTCLNNARGIVLSMSVNDTLISNNCSRNTYGILIYSSSFIILSNNSCTENDMGISFYWSTNNQLTNNSCLSNRVNGTEFFSLSNNNTLVGNRCNSNGGNGIDVDTCSNETLISNTCFNNGQGIVLYLSSNNTLGNNTCSSNSYDGIFLFSSTNNTLINNTCSSNSYVGMSLFSSNNNTLNNNNCSDNGYGIGLMLSNCNAILNNTMSDNILLGLSLNWTSSHNCAWNNTFSHNNGAGDVYDPSHAQAVDMGTDNRWNTSGSPHGYGNYWSDWTIPDVDPPDGIVDVPYDIAGTAGAKDYYPQTTTPTEPIPEFGMMPLVVTVMLAAFILAREGRRRKA